MKKLKSLKELEKQRLLEIEKCKNDIIYFFEEYCYPKHPLTNCQKYMIKIYQQAKYESCDLVLFSGKGHSRWILYNTVERHEEFKKEN
jgi:hypothetical protein